MEILRFCEVCEGPLGPEEDSVCRDAAACAESKLMRYRREAGSFEDLSSSRDQE
jgi:hypothetical protein